eukprot:gnl/TRDRNA2_/TRDRNA2_176601_c4_seq5.p1 gnl/TRDRNA2_/TRDRNA2_176601_c4~~gnl/TRDRNA2_/TRDRNA2_176601_c4_seq5.p1  ORF type:complete len:636 (+),score=105.02 gnl/TRDRNA2_/TRDRNA2_176601_c4_seq5:2-1909(+)
MGKSTRGAAAARAKTAAAAPKAASAAAAAAAKAKSTRRSSSNVVVVSGILFLIIAVGGLPTAKETSEDVCREGDVCREEETATAKKSEPAAKSAAKLNEFAKDFKRNEQRFPDGWGKGTPITKVQTRLSQLPQSEMPTPQDVEPRLVSRDPRIHLFDNFLSHEECDYLMAKAQGRLQPAGVVEQEGNKYAMDAKRTNDQVWLTYQEEKDEPLLAHILKRMHRVAHVPDDEAEALQVGRYELDQKYEMHIDSAPEHDVARPATMIIFLEEPSAGGETFWPISRANGDSCRADWHVVDGEKTFGAKHCCANPPPGSVRVVPKKGRAILFWSHHSNGKKNEKSAHSGCPVLGGEKWIAQLWFRFVPYEERVDAGFTQFPKDLRFDGFPPAPPPKFSDGTSPGRLEPRVLHQKYPRVYMYDEFLTVSECKHLISLAGTMTTSTDHKSLPQADVMSDMEISSVPDELSQSDAVVAAIIKRAHRIVYIPEGHALQLVIGKYSPGGRMDVHLDSDPKAKKIHPYSLIMYLTGDGQEAGGETIFPATSKVKLSDQSSDDVLEQACEMQGYEDNGPLRVAPKAGRAVLLASHTLEGKLDLKSRHGACPAGQNGKWVAQLFFMNSKRKGAPELPADDRYDLPRIV